VYVTVEKAKVQNKKNKKSEKQLGLPHLTLSILEAETPSSNQFDV